MKNTILLIMLMIFSSFACASQTQKVLGIHKVGDQVVFYNESGNAIKTIDLKAKTIIYKDKTAEYFEVMQGKNFTRFLNALASNEITTTFEGSNQTQEKTEYLYNELGLVKTVKYFNSDNSLRMQRNYVYNERGHQVMMETIETSRGVSSSISQKYTYNKNGFLVKKECYRKNELFLTQEFEYNEAKQLIRIRDSDPKQIAWSWKEYAYGPNSQLKNLDVLNFDQFNSDGYLDDRSVFQYNERGLVGETQHFDGSNQLYIRYIRTYDKAGLLVQEKALLPTGKVQDEYKLEYDKAGRLTKLVYIKDNKTVSVSKYLY